MKRQVKPLGDSLIGGMLLLIMNSVTADSAIDLWYGLDQRFADLGEPQRQSSILGNVSAPEGVASLIDSLNGAPALLLCIDPVPNKLHGLAGLGDFNVELLFADLLEGNQAQQIKFEIASDAPQYLRIGRVGDQWPQWYSRDGVNRLSAGSFNLSLPVTSVGLFVGSLDTSSPAYTVLIDNFKVLGAVALSSAGVPVTGFTSWDSFIDTLTHDGMASSRWLSASNGSRIRRS